MTTEGIELTESFVQQYNQILLKYGDSATINPVTTPQASVCIIIIYIIIIIIIIIIIKFNVMFQLMSLSCSLLFGES